MSGNRYEKSLFKQASIEFMLGKKHIQFVVYHNLPDVFGLSIDCAVDNWINRTTKYTAEDFCQYVLKKQPDRVCITRHDYLKLIGAL